MIPHYDLTTTTIGVKLLYDELIYDLHFATNRIARLTFVNDQGQPTDLAPTASTEDKKNADYIDRLIVSAINNVNAHTSFCNLNKDSRMTTDSITHQREYQLAFAPSRNWSGSAATLCTYIHDYVVNYVASKWLSLVGVKQAEFFASQADEMLNSAVYELRKQSLPDTPTLYNILD